MGMFFARDNGVDLYAYHQLMYDAAHKDKIDIENAAALADYVKNIADAEKFREALKKGEYTDELNAANDHAYESSGVWYLPAFRMNGKKLDSKGGVGVTAEQLKYFLTGAVIK